MAGPLGSCAYNIQTWRIEAAFYTADWGSLAAAQDAARAYVYQANRPIIIVCALGSAPVRDSLVRKPAVAGAAG